MENIKFLLKFGEKKYLQDLVDGKLYFNTAEKLRGIEEELRIKGQGDRLEGSTKIFAADAKMTTKDGFVLFEGVSGNFLIRYSEADKIPVCCFFSVRRKDCIRIENEKWKVHLSDNIKNMIKQHFPKADSVVIIHEPQRFVNDIFESIGQKCLSEPVHYYHIDEGVINQNTKELMQDPEYVMYLFQDMDIKKTRALGGTLHEVKITSEVVCKTLFCKDVFFKDEQEFRFLLPTIRIDHGMKFDVSISERLEIMDLDEFFRDY